MEHKKLADELKELIALDPVERSFMRYADEARTIAMAGGTEMQVSIMKKNYFADQLTHTGAAKNSGPEFDAQIDELYQAQHKLIQRFKDDGCTVTEEKPSPIVIADIGSSPFDSRITMGRAEMMQREFENQYVESKCTISWAPAKDAIIT